MVLLEKAVSILRDGGFAPSNVDVVIITEAPKIGPHSEAMAGRLAEVMGIQAGLVSVKGKSNEGMGWIGAGEGLAVHAVALVTKK
jgi:2-C-methyl-D-erythritol 2,4-cyclodiphosphate synthase